MASLNLLFVHEVNYQSKVIFEMHEFPELLAARGNQITYLDFPEGHKFWSGSRPKTQLKIPGRTEPQISLQLERPFTFGVPGLDRLLATISVIPKLISLLRSNRFDAIVLYAVPTYGAQVVWLAKLFGIPIVFRALDVSHKIRKSIFSPAIKAVEKYIYKNVALLSANNPAMAEYCVELSGRSRATVTNLPPLDLSHFSKCAPDSSLRSHLGIEAGDDVITYLGSFFYFSGLDTVIREFAAQIHSYPKAKLLLIGGGEQDAELRGIVDELGLADKVVFTGFIPYADLGKYLAMTTVAINPMRPDLVSNTAFPHKVIQYMASGLPVVSTRLTGLYKTFGDESGLTWSDSTEGLLLKALDLSADKQRCDSNAAKERQVVSSKFGIESAVSAFELTIRSVLVNN
jgi:glycosyltransferase involved in cell wall biosynthesis